MKKIVFPVIVAAAYGIVFFLLPEGFFSALRYLLSFLLEMIQVLPFVLLLSALVVEWVPARVIQKNLGPKSGIKGIFFSFLLGSISAGPIYAAFPVCLSLHKKGSSVRNLLIIISSWAVIKIPMLFMELKFLGARFTFLRYTLTIPAILAIAAVTAALVKPGEIKTIENDPLPFQLPGKDCGTCGYASCRELAYAAADNTAILEKCIFLHSRQQTAEGN